MIVDGKLAISS